MSGSERGLVEEYVEKVPNPSLKSEWGWPGREGPARGLSWGQEGPPASKTAWQGGLGPRAFRDRGRTRDRPCLSTCAYR